MLTTGGLNLLTNAYTSNNASIITMLKPWEERQSKEEQLKALLAAARRKFAAYPEAVSLVFPPPPINGLGNASGFVFELQDKDGPHPAGTGCDERQVHAGHGQAPELTGIYSGYSTTVPQIKLDIDRDKARTLNVPVNDVFRGLQIYLGGLQVNDFNLFGRTYKVMLQAEQDFRKTPENINDIYVRSKDNSMVPLSTVEQNQHDDRPGHSAALQHVPNGGDQRRKWPRHLDRRGTEGDGGPRRKELPQGYGFEWTSIAFQEKEAGGTQGPIFGMAMVFVFLVLAAQYESWAVPFSVLLGLRSAYSALFSASTLSVWKTTSMSRSGLSP